MSFNLSTIRGSAAWSTAAPKFGTHNLSSCVCGNASADTFLSSTGAPGGTLTTGTIEGWVNTAGTGTKVWCGRDNWYWVGMVGNNLEAHYGDGASEVVLATTTVVNDGVWHHWALVFNAGAASLFSGTSGTGNRVATSATVKTVGTPAQATFTLGGFLAVSTYDFPYGGLDEVRISNIARYSGTTYTVPTAAFTDDANTVALYHLDNDGTDSHVASQSGTALLSLSASAGASGAGSATASLSLLATAANGLNATGSAALSLVAAATPAARAAATAHLDLIATALAMALSGTDTSNSHNGRTRSGRATVTITRPAVPPPPGRTFGERYDKAIAFPTPVLVDGRIT